MPWQRWRKGNVSRPPANFGWTKSISHQVSDSILNVNTNHVKEIPKAPHPSVLCFPRRSQKQDGKSNVSRHPPYLPLCQIRPYQELRAQQELVWALCPLPFQAPGKTVPEDPKNTSPTRRQYLHSRTWNRCQHRRRGEGARGSPMRGADCG